VSTEHFLVHINILVGKIFAIRDTMWTQNKPKMLLQMLVELTVRPVLVFKFILVFIFISFLVK